MISILNITFSVGYDSGKLNVKPELRQIWGKFGAYLKYSRG